MKIETTMNDPVKYTVEKKMAKVVVTYCLATKFEIKSLKRTSSVKSLLDTNIKHIPGAIATNMQTAATGKYRIFVLPSQLNAAEYQSEKVDHVDGISLKNGYLQVKENADVTKFEAQLHLMTVMGVMDVPVRGLVKDRKSFVKQTNSAVGLIYASAVPINAYGNGSSDAVNRVADLTLFAQYTGSMRLAVDKTNCELYLMPLGGGYFKNNRANVRAAMVSAAALMEKELKKANVEVFVLTFDEKQDEVDFFST
jgi:hypothetical protein